MLLTKFIQFILVSFLAFSSPHISNNNKPILETTPIDTTKSLLIQNYDPKGNGSLDGTGNYGYKNPEGKNFGYIVFLTKIINKTTDPVEINMNFSADSVAIPRQPQAYVKFFIPPDIMTFAKESLNDFGLTDLKSFLDKNYYKPSQIKRTIKPNDECYFYVVAISKGYYGVARAGLVLKDQNLFYQTNMLDSLISCGNVVFEK